MGFLTKTGINCLNCSKYLFELLFGLKYKFCLDFNNVGPVDFVLDLCPLKDSIHWPVFFSKQFSGFW